MGLVPHACKPSAQVYTAFESMAAPQLLNQAPPGAQQLRSPDFLMPHLRHVMQACKPSAHVCSKFESSEPPQLLNHEPPAAQQFRSPDFFLMPHLGHAIALTTADVVCRTVDMNVLVILLAQACKPSVQVCSKFESPTSPQFSNQAPPAVQQFRSPDFLMPHLAHAELTVVVLVPTNLTLPTWVNGSEVYARHNTLYYTYQHTYLLKIDSHRRLLPPFQS